MGIYQIKHIPSGACFIGSSLSMHNAFLRTMQTLIVGEHGNAELQTLWASAGPVAFDYSIVEQVEKRDSLFLRERHWMEKLAAHPLDPIAYEREAQKYRVACSFVSVQKSLRDDIRSIQPQAMVKNIRVLIDFYRKHKS